MKVSRTGLGKPTPQQIQTLAQAIAQTFHPTKVILFGSYAYGSPTEESDVDLLVIMPTRLHPPEQALAIRRTLDCPFALDLLVRTPEQIAERLQWGDGFMQEIVSRGQVLYEADHA
ncbi:MAG: nucleotidyltransferase domain-containing protein [Candidatus Binatia bacterium]